MLSPGAMRPAAATDEAERADDADDDDCDQTGQDVRQLTVPERHRGNG